MKLNVDSELPIYLQIANGIEDAVFTGAFAEETQIPSTTELSTSLQINPATVLKGMNLLVDEGILYKRRGLGMFVRQGAHAKVTAKRQSQFYERYIGSLVIEARKLGLQEQDVIDMIKRGFSV